MDLGPDPTRHADPRSRVIAYDERLEEIPACGPFLLGHGQRRGDEMDGRMGCRKKGFPGRRPVA
jgi:hypothetical protein